MKKLSRKGKLLNLKHAAKSNKRRLIHNLKKRIKLRLEHEENRAQNLSEYRKVWWNKETKEIVIEAPENFSVIDNAREMLNFFNQFRRYEKQKYKIFFDMSKVKQITGDAIVYMLASFDWHRKKYGHLHIRGNSPSDEGCKELFHCSGFFKYMHTVVPIDKTRKDVLQLTYSDNVKPNLASEVINFAKIHLKLENRSQAKAIYRTIIECMSNTKNHAYEKGNINPLWYLMAIYYQSRNEIHFTFFDSGLGIPTTIRRDKLEHITEKVSQFVKKISKGIHITSDSDLIVSALNGEFRTSTALEHRGKGLPAIKQCCDNKDIDDLIIVSRQGYVNLQGKNDLLPTNLLGTIISWKIRRIIPEVNNE